MNAFEKILSEIDNGIKTIKPLMKGDTRQIAESQIIGLEEAKKIVEKYKDDGWIPCGEKLPEMHKVPLDYDEYYMVSDSVLVTDGNSVFISEYEVDDDYCYGWYYYNKLAETILFI